MRHAQGVWTADVALPAGRCCEYKYVLFNAAGAFAAWQAGADAVLPIYRDDAWLEARDDWSNDPTLSNVLSAGDAQDTEPRLESRQSRLLLMLSQLGDAVQALDEAAADHAQRVATATAAAEEAARDAATDQS
jgi:hypothetical protein